MTLFSRAALLATALGFALSTAYQSVYAQPPGRQVDGMIQTVADNNVTLMNGPSFPVTDATRVSLIRYGTIADLEPGKFVAISSRSGAGGMMEAVLVARFAEGLTPNEGQREMPITRFCEPGCSPGDLMTNAAIMDARLDAVSAGEMEITFAGQSGTVMLTPETRVELQSAGTLADIASGANVLGFINDEGAAAIIWVYLD